MEEVILGPLGLDPYAEAVYIAMLEQPRSDLADLVASTGLPEKIVRAALYHLADLTFVRPSRESPPAYGW